MSTCGRVGSVDTVLIRLVLARFKMPLDPALAGAEASEPTYNLATVAVKVSRPERSSVAWADELPGLGT
jgi:hypothetical protein